MMSEQPRDCGHGQYDGHNGMSLRDYFAAHAPQVDELYIPTTTEQVELFLGLKPGSYKREIHWPAAVAKARYAYADAMMEARKA